MLKLGAYESWFNGEVIVPGETFEDRLANLEAWGYQGIQILRPTMELGKEAIKKALSTSSVQLCIYGRGGDLLSADESLRRKGVEELKLGLREAAELGSIGWIMAPMRQSEIVAPLPPKTLYEYQCEILVEQLREIAPVAEETGACIILESLNRYESRFMNLLEEGADICRAVGSAGIKIMADFFHMNIEEADIGRAIAKSAEHIAYVHLADSNRYQPGAGHLDFRPGLAALKHAGYDGFMTLECRLMGADKGKALQESAQYIRAIWDEV